jgi:cell wall-associated NlpC family hydrolase
MTLTPDGTRLPRRSFEMAASAPGVVTVPNTGTKPTSTAALAPGDLLFWDASTNDGTQIDHVGIYLGLDSADAPRFISSRKTVDGPTLGDVGGKSLLSGTGLYATSWRAARRL